MTLYLCLVWCILDASNFCPFSSFSLAVTGSEDSYRNLCLTVRIKPVIHIAYSKIMLLFSRGTPKVDTIWETKQNNSPWQTGAFMLLHSTKEWCSVALLHTFTGKRVGVICPKVPSAHLPKPSFIVMQVFNFLENSPAAHSRCCCWVSVVKGSQNRACCSSLFRWRGFLLLLAPRCVDSSKANFLVREKWCKLWNHARALLSLSGQKGLLVGAKPSASACLTSSLVSALCWELVFLAT